MNEQMIMQAYDLAVERYAAIGIDAPWNIKRAQVSAAETNQNTDLSKYNILPVRDRIEKQLQAANAALGTNYHVVVTVDEVDDEQREEVTQDADPRTPDDMGGIEADSRTPV